MSPINSHNEQKIKDMEKTLKDHLLWLVKYGMDRSIDFVERARNLKQFVIGLSIAISGLVLPQLINNTQTASQNFFILSFIEFCIVTLWGLITLIIPTLKEPLEFPKISNHHIEQTLEMVKNLQEIQKITDNNTAGVEYEKWKTSYKTLDLGQPSKNIFFMYSDMLLYSTFIVAFVLMIMGLFKGLNY